MEIHHIGENNSVLNTFIAEIRDHKIQKDSLRFRRNIERIGEILSYELSKNLSYSVVDVEMHNKFAGFETGSSVVGFALRPSKVGDDLP
jgi:uracil phosphoribosyltransferase